METLLNGLKNLGLGGHEARVYAALLGCSPANATLVAKKSHLSRSSVYTALYALSAKGLVSTTYENDVKQFIATDVGGLGAWLDREKRAFEQKAKTFETLRASLEALAGPRHGVPRVEFFEGQEGLKKAYLALLRQAKPGMVLRLARDEFIWRPEWAFVFEPEWHERIRRQKQEKGIVTRLLMNASALERQKASFYEKKVGTDSRFLPKAFTLRDFACYLLGDTACLLSFEEGNLLGIKVVNATIAQNLQVLFDLAWAAASPAFSRGKA